MAAATEADERPLADLVERLTPAVVRVTALDAQGRGGTFGTAFAIDMNGRLVTNHHVVKGAQEVRVTFTDHVDLPARVIGADPVADLALLAVERSTTPLELASTAPRAGDAVFTIGTPYRVFAWTVTRGIVSATGRVTTSPVPLLQTDLAINVGNSGGPLFDATGAVAGVIVQSFGPTRTANTGINFAIGADTLRRVLPRLARGERVPYPLLGADLEAVTYARAASSGYRGPDGSDRMRGSGAFVVAVRPQTPAARADLRAGDIVSHFDGVPVHGYTELVSRVGLANAGSEARLRVFRDGGFTDLRVRLDLLR